MATNPVSPKTDGKATGKNGNNGKAAQPARKIKTVEVSAARVLKKAATERPELAATLAALRDVEGGADLLSAVLAVDLEKPAAEATANKTDMGNARRIARKAGPHLRYVAELGWLAWTGARWERSKGAAVRAAKETVRTIYAEAAACDDDGERQALGRWAQASESAAKIGAMLALAESEPEIEARVEQFDAASMLLNCPNATVDLSSGKARPHNPGDMITRVAGVEYLAGAACPLWLAFLDRIFDGNKNLIGFIRRAVGYSLTGDTGEQALFLCYGTGANGKSTLLETVRYVLGDYSQAAEFSTFLARHFESGGPRNDIARLAGVRFAAAIEADESARLNESLIKQLTGGDTVAARYLHREYFEFKPQFKIWLAANHLPKVQGTDNAIWRRIKQIPFEVTIPAKERDPKLPAKLRAEGPGILAWAVAGALEWQRAGLGEPAEVTKATEAYRAEMDTLAGFLAERVNVGEGKVSAAALHKAYLDYSGESLDARAFKARMVERGFVQKHEVTGSMWQGLSLPDMFQVRSK